ncbi:hypothetical protein EV426DRAFT_84287 [Tirmania nivea]|nr:hypothetical protein EV426DRAFT_84287 [Tirmania nivea]
MVLTKTLSKRRKNEGEMVKRKSSVSKLQISAPVELISTTNMISYTAPTLHNSPLSSTSPSTSGRFFPLAASPVSSPSTSDIESPSPPTSPTTIRPNHLSTYFSSAPVPPPMSPARSLSTRSSTSFMPQRSASSSSTSSKQQRRSQGPPPRVAHRGMGTSPFGAELAKVSEVAEVYGLRDISDAEEEFMYSHGLQKFCADDYLREIGPLGCAFNDELPTLNPGWI